MRPEALLARRLWTVAEPIHALTYFAPEARTAFEDAGYRGFWRGYFAGRAAPLGAVGSGAVTAVFFGFHPDFVARAIPTVWDIGSPTVALAARLAGIEAAFRSVVGDPDRQPVVEAADLLLTGVAGCPAHGRPLFAANAELDVPDEPHLRLWHAVTLLREFRGDGHVHALEVAGIDPCEAHVTAVAAIGADLEIVKPHRGWEEGDWDAAIERLRRRGWIDVDGALTELGRDERAAVEELTDELSARFVDELGENGAHLLLALLAPMAAAVVDCGIVPFPNPMGVPRPR